jgi:hypothetical protein
MNLDGLERDNVEVEDAVNETCCLPFISPPL